MRWYSRIALAVVVCSASVSAVSAQEPPAKSDVNIELRWVESEHMEGLTDRGMRYQLSENAGDFGYPHRKPALVLTPDVVEKVRIAKLRIAARNQYAVSIQITENAREALARTFEGKETRWITVVVDGKCWGGSRYEPANKESGYSKSSGVWATNYNPWFGYTSSKAYVDRVVDALSKKPTPKKAAQPRHNQVYVKAIMPADPVDGDKDRPVVESWIAEELKKRGQATFSAVTGWVPLDLGFLEATDVWDGVLGDQSFCRVGADIERGKGPIITIHLSGWSPGGAFLDIQLKDEPGNRAIVAVKDMKSEKGMPYVAVLIGPPAEKPAGPTDRKQ